MAKSAKPRSTKSKQAQPNRILNLLPSKDTDKDWGFAAAMAAGPLGAAPAKLPASVDLRADWWTVGDQANTGSCVGWASTDGVARYLFAKAGRLDKKTMLSPRFTWMASKETDHAVDKPQTMLDCAGTYLKTASDVLRKYGAVTDDLCPFILSAAMYTGDEDDFFATAATRKIASYFNLQRNMAEWKRWLASKGPILVGLSVDDTFGNATATGGKLARFQPATVRGGHAVCLVGYKSDGTFIIRNSWGTGWGDKGFAYATPSYVSAAFFPESYGMTL
ncbi:MAG TPA: C1 family peptidase [Sphingomicrobium sp.]|nr:C1 family peptidase [Sphingomicrobium sp.]